MDVVTFISLKVNVLLVVVATVAPDEVVAPKLKPPNDCSTATVGKLEADVAVCKMTKKGN